MIGEHSRPAFYDIYFCQSSKEPPASAVAFSALGVERRCGSGDAMELEFPPPSAVGEGGTGGGELPSVSASVPLSSLERLRFSTTRMIAGERAWAHLEKYAPAALQLYSRPQRSAPASPSSSSGADSPAASDSAVVCLGAMMLVSR
ncbi:hypothetical protein EV177_008003 [Coemansia sp. RSA 1804]|nr:hypothetical protein EV177_008003 [Coemansia sp. RSA 1804]